MNQTDRRDLDAFKVLLLIVVAAAVIYGVVYVVQDSQKDENQRIERLQQIQEP